MEIDELIEAYLASRKKQFARLGKEGVARVAYLAGYLAAQQQLAPDGAYCPACHSLNAFYAVVCVDCGAHTSPRR